MNRKTLNLNCIPNFLFSLKPKINPQTRSLLKFFPIKLAPRIRAKLMKCEWAPSAVLQKNVIPLNKMRIAAQ